MVSFVCRTETSVDPRQSREGGMLDPSESGNSQSRSATLSRALDPKGYAAGQLIDLPTFHTSCKDFNSQHLVISGSSHAWKGRSVTPAFSTRDRLPFVVCRSKDGDSWRYAESAIRLGLFLKRSMDLALSMIVLVLVCPLMI